MAMERDEDWLKCLDWLKRCQVISTKDSPLFKDDVAIYELSNQMKYGVIICHLLNILCPGAIDSSEFSARPQSSQFLCMKNIRIFLSTCKKVFHMDEVDLFDQYELYNMSNFAKVIRCMSVLSNTHIALSRGIAGFKLNVEVDTEDTYGFLQHLDNTREPVAEEEEEEEDIYSMIDHQSDDKIYEDLCSIRARRSRTMIIEVPKTKRDMVINELVTTEYNFLNQLNLIIKYHLEPMKEVMSSSDHDVIFNHIKDLHRIHSGFYTDIENACKDPTVGKNALKPLRGAGGIGVLSISVRSLECFSKYKKDFTIYGNYCISLKYAYEMLESCSKSDSNLGQLIQKCEQDSHAGRFRLRDLLNVPMQRILKYHLLIENLVKETDGNEKCNLRGALDNMKDIATYINEVKRDVENIETVKSIFSQIHNIKYAVLNDYKVYGKFLCDASIRIKDNKDNKILNRHAFLFDKVFILVKVKMIEKLFWEEGYDFKKLINIKSVKLSIIPESQMKEEKWGYQFLITDKSTDETYTIYNKTRKDISMFITNFSGAISNNCPEGYNSNGYSFIYTSFPESQTCDVCGLFLYGLMYQGYLCKNTNKKVHKNCITHIKRLSRNTEEMNISKEQIETKIKNAKQLKVKRAKAIKDYIPNENNYTTMPPDNLPSLPLSSGDIIDVLETTLSGWWKGSLDGYTGWFPQKNVNIIIVGNSNEIANKRKASLTVNIQSLKKYSCAVKKEDATDSKTATVELTPELPPRSTSRPNHLLPWFVADIARKTATEKLSTLKTGTFMVRPRDEEFIPYAISINYNNSVKHIKVQMNSDEMYYIADVKLFRNIIELVSYYEENTLDKSFPGLITTLKFPYRSIAYPQHQSLELYEVMYDFQASQANQLTLHKGDIVGLISNIGDERGWWKGTLDGQVTSSQSPTHVRLILIHLQIGFFPLQYVKKCL